MLQSVEDEVLKELLRMYMSEVHRLLQKLYDINMIPSNRINIQHYDK